MAITWFRAGWIAPVSGPPIKNGFIGIEDGLIREVRSSEFSPPKTETLVDLGSWLLMPGLVDLHSRVETALLGPHLANVDPHRRFKILTRLGYKVMTVEDHQVAAAWSVARSIRSGVTAVADVGSQDSTPRLLASSGLCTHFYVEFSGPHPVQAEDRLQRGARAAVRLRNDLAETVTLGLAPAGLHAVSRALLTRTVPIARREQLDLCLPLAQNPAEADLIRTATGPLADLLAERRVPLTPYGVSPIQFLEATGFLAMGPLIPLALPLEAADRVILKNHPCRLAFAPSVISGHNPRGASDGTTSLISQEDLRADLKFPDVSGIGSGSAPGGGGADLFETARCLAASWDPPDPANLLAAMTHGGASGLGRGAELGTLETGKRASLIAIDLADRVDGWPDVQNPIASLMAHASSDHVAMTMIDGSISYQRDGIDPLDRMRESWPLDGPPPNFEKGIRDLGRRLAGFLSDPRNAK